MDLFSELPQEKINLLPADGEVFYYGSIMDTAIANEFYEKLLQEIAWKNDEAVIFGKRIITNRKVAWYADAPFDYTYSNNTKKALPWTPALRSLKLMAEEKSGETFNSCLLNLYHNGNEGMAWHSDAEKALKQNGAIASISLGAERKFSFKHKQTKDTCCLVLQHGSLLLMTGTTQQNWLHRLPPTKKISTARINLTFRTIVF